MFAYDGFNAMEQDRDVVRSHFEDIYGSDGPQADEEALRLIDMVTKLNIAMPDKNGLLESYAGWKEYVNSSAFDRDTLSWTAFKELTAPFNWDAFLEELSKRTVLKQTLHFAEQQPVWAFSREYFSWWHPEHFSVQVSKPTGVRCC
jgi:hypothetical protein